MVSRIALLDGRRGDACCQKLIQRIDDSTCLFITDEWPGFFRLLPEERPLILLSLLSELRHQLARFTRKTKASSRSLLMVHLSLKLAHHLQDSQTLTQYMTPILSIFS